MEIQTNQQTAETVYINHPEASYGIFCFNSVGDLFLNSDYGFYGFAWRSYGDNFKKFLGSLNADYVLNKFEINYRDTVNKNLPKIRKEMIKILIEVFINHIKSNYP